MILQTSRPVIACNLDLLASALPDVISELPDAVVISHTACDLRSLLTARYFVMLRDPVSRAVSEWIHVAPNTPLVEFSTVHRVDNVMVRTLSGCGGFMAEGILDATDLYRAVDFLKQCEYVGRMDRFLESIEAILTRLGARFIESEHQRRGDNHLISDNQRAAILNYNYLDEKLWSIASSW
jgi:hypothetical protein